MRDHQVVGARVQHHSRVGRRPFRSDGSGEVAAMADGVAGTAAAPRNDRRRGEWDSSKFFPLFLVFLLSSHSGAEEFFFCHFFPPFFNLDTTKQKKGWPHQALLRALRRRRRRGAGDCGKGPPLRRRPSAPHAGLAARHRQTRPGRLQLRALLVPPR